MHGRPYPNSHDETLFPSLLSSPPPFMVVWGYDPRPPEKFLELKMLVGEF